MKKQLTAIMMLLMTVFIGFGIIIPVLPLMIDDAGASRFHLNLMLAVYAAAGFLMSPVWGALSDRVGRRPIIMLGVIGFSISFLLFGISSGNLWMMYISRIIGGLFSGAVTSCAIAYITDITTDEQRTKGMGLVGMSIGLGFIFGPAIGGFLSVFGHEFPFFAAAALSIIAWMITYKYVPESLTHEKRSLSRDERPSRWAAFQGPVKYLYVLGFFISFTLAGLESSLQYFEIEKINVTPAQIGIMFLVCGLVGALIQGGVIRRYVKKGAEPNVIRLGLLLSALGFILLLWSHNLFTATLYLSIFGAGNALLRPCVTSLITQKTRAEQGISAGLSSSMDSLGRITGPLLAGTVYSINIGFPFLFGGVLCIAAIALLYRFLAADTQSQASEAA